MALTSSLNWRSCRIPYQSLHSLNAVPSFSAKVLFFTDFRIVASHSGFPKAHYNLLQQSKPLLDTMVIQTVLRPKAKMPRPVVFQHSKRRYSAGTTPSTVLRTTLKSLICNRTKTYMITRGRALTPSPPQLVSHKERRSNPPRNIGPFIAWNCTQHGTQKLPNFKSIKPKL